MGSMNASRRSASARELQQTDELQIPASPPPTLYSNALSFIRNRRQKYRAPRNAHLNHAHCVFYRLPAELHACIALYLAGADLLSFAQCSQKTTWLVYHFQPSRSVKTAFSARLRRDRDIRRLARSRIDVQTVAWCSSHRTLHHVALFAHTQLADDISSDERVCVGVKGRFRLCEHQSFSLEELHYETSGCLPTTCDKHVDREEGIIGLRIIKRVDGARCVVANTHVILRLPFHETIGVATVQKQLARLSVHICPHLTSADESFISAVCTVKNKHYRNRSILVGERQAFSTMGNCRYCLAEYTLHRREGGGSLLLDVRRKIPYLLDRPVNEKVLVHFEDCGEMHCAYEEGSWECKRTESLKLLVASIVKDFRS